MLPSATPADVEMIRKAMEGARQAGALFVFVGAADAVGQLAAMESGGVRRMSTWSIGLTGRLTHDS